MHADFSCARSWVLRFRSHIFASCGLVRYLVSSSKKESLPYAESTGIDCFNMHSHTINPMKPFALVSSHVKASKQHYCKFWRKVFYRWYHGNTAVEQFYYLRLHCTKNSISSSSHSSLSPVPRYSSKNPDFATSDVFWIAWKDLVVCPGFPPAQRLFALPSHSSRTATTLLGYRS